MRTEENKHTFAKDFADILVSIKAITPQEAENMKKAFAQSNALLFEEFIIDEGLIEKQPVLVALGQYYKVPFIDVIGEFFDHLLLTNFPKDFLLRNRIIPLSIDNEELVVVAAEPTTPGLASAIEKFSNNDVVFMVGIGRDIIDSIEEFYDKAPTEVSEDINLRQEDVDLRQEKQLKREEEDYEEREDDIFRSKL